MRRAVACAMSLALCLAFLPVGAIAPAHAAPDSSFVPIVEDPDSTAANLVLIVSFNDSPEDGFYNQAYTAGSNKYYKTNLDRLEDALNGEPNTYNTNPVTLPSGMKANVSQNIAVRLNTHSITRAIDEELKITDLSYYFDAPEAFASCIEYVSWSSSNEDVIKVTQGYGDNDWNLEYVAPGEATLTVTFAPPAFDPVSDSCSITLTRIDEKEKVNQSYREYFETISKGDYNIKSYFPQMKTDGTYVPIRIDMDAEEYADHYAKYIAAGAEDTDGSGDAVGNPDHNVISSVVQQLNNMRGDIDASIFDKRNDGIIDNVLIIFDAPQGVEIPSHAVKCNHFTNERIGSGSGARGIDRINCISGGAAQDDASKDSFNMSVAAQKRLESLGVKELGRNNGTPVGSWDIMAEPQSFTWPLAATRDYATDTVNGQEWVDIIDITLTTTPDNQTFTVYSPDAFDPRDESKPQAYRIKIDRLNRSEYFVLEYRKKEQYPAYDSSIPASGLIVYRVNPSFVDDGNVKGNDYIYVFRPGETGLTDSKGDIARAPIAAGAYTQQYGLKLNSSIGSTDMTAGITSGAICYSDGSNSGIRIVAKEQTDDSLTFCVEQSSELRNNTWFEAFDKNKNENPFTTCAEGGYALTSLTKDENGYLYAVDEDASYNYGKFCVRQFTGDTWIPYGPEVSNRTEAMKNVDIVWFDSTIYAIGYSPHLKATLIKKYTGTKWQTVGTINSKGSTNDFPQLAIVNSELYALYSHTSSGVTEFGVWKLNESNFIACGTGTYGASITANNVSSALLQDVGGKPALIIGSSAGTNMQVLNVANNATQSTWGSAQRLSANAATILDGATAALDTYIYAYSSSASNKAQLFKFDAAGKQLPTQNVDFAKDASRIGNLSGNGSDLFLTINSGTKGIEVYELEGGSASGSAVKKVGNTISVGYTGDYNAHTVAMSNRVYVAIAGKSVEQVSVQYHGIGEEAPAPPDPEAEDVTISFDANGGSGAPAPVSGKAGAQVSVLWPTATPTRSSYDFDGWYTASTGGTLVTGYPANFPAQNTTYYAHWKAKSTTPTDPNKPTDPTKPGDNSGNSGNNQGNNTGNGDNQGSSDETKEESQIMYRMYNPNSGEHFYTASTGERDALVKAQWHYEGEAWTAPKTSNTPVYRLYSGTDHHYTTNAGERDSLVKAGWSYEGIGWYSDDKERVGLHRLFNPNVNPNAPTNNSGSHHYTTNKGEADALVKIGWQYEGIGWHGM